MRHPILPEAESILRKRARPARRTHRTPTRRLRRRAPHGAQRRTRRPGRASSTSWLLVGRGRQPHREARRRRPAAFAASTRPPWASTIAGDDREPEPGARPAALAAALGAPEALEQRAPASPVGQARAVVAHLERDARRRRAATATSIGVPGGRVHERVAQQVRRAPGAAGAGRRARRRSRRRLELRSSRSGAVARASSTASRGERARRRRARAPGRAPRPAARASAGPRRARPCAPPRPRSAASPSRRPPGSRAAPMRNSSA